MVITVIAHPTFKTIMICGRGYGFHGWLRPLRLKLMLRWRVLMIHLWKACGKLLQIMRWILLSLSSPWLEPHLWKSHWHPRSWSPQGSQVSTCYNGLCQTYPVVGLFFVHVPPALKIGAMLAIGPMWNSGHVGTTYRLCIICKNHTTLSSET